MAKAANGAVGEPVARLTEGSVRGHLYRMTLPMIWGILAAISVSLADTYFVAQLGPRHLAAISFTFPVLMSFISLSIGLSAGTAAVLARALGRGDQQQAKRIATDAMTLASVIVLIASVGGLATIDPLFRLLGAEPELLPMIKDYMEIWYLGIIFLVVPLVGSGAMRAMGDSRLAGLVLGGASLLNILLDPLLIFGLLGLPRLEMQGAALATVLARSATFALTLWAMGFKLDLLTNPFPGWARLWRSWSQILHIGLPAAGTNLVIPFGNGVIIWLLAGHSEAAVAGFGAATRVEGIALVVFYAVSSVIGPFMGQNLGAGRGDRIQAALRESAVFCLGFGLLVAILLALAGGLIAGLFSDDPSVTAHTRLYLLIAPISYGCAGIVMIVNAAFNGLGRPGRGVVVSLARVFGVALPLAWLGGQFFGIAGIFAAVALANLVVGGGAYLWARRVCGRIAAQGIS